MTEPETIGEELSSLVDGELNSAKYESTVNALKQNPDLKKRWERYHIAADSLKNTLPPIMVKSDFADRVMQAVHAEPTVLAPRHLVPRLTPVARQIAGLAVAASVTAIAVLGVQTWSANSGGAASEVAQIAVPVQQTAVQPVVATVNDPKALPENLQLQINRYLLNHNQNALTVHGMLPYARIVGYAANEPTE